MPVRSQPEPPLSDLSKRVEPCTYIGINRGPLLLPAGYYGISPVEIYKPLCGAIEVAPQGGFIVRMGMLFR